MIRIEWRMPEGLTGHGAWHDESSLSTMQLICDHANAVLPGSRHEVKSSGLLEGRREAAQIDWFKDFPDDPDPAYIDLIEVDYPPRR